jgi:putative transcription factor
MTKVDRSDEIIKPKTVGRTVGQAIQKRRGEMTPKLTAKELGAKVAMNENDMKAFERGDAPFNSAKLQKLENVLKIKLLGDNIGAPKEMGPKKKAPEKK